MLFLLALAVVCASSDAIISSITMTDDYYLTIKTYELLYSIDIWAGDKLAVHINHKIYGVLNLDYHNLEGKWQNFFNRNTYDTRMPVTANEEYTIFHDGNAFIIKSSFGLKVTMASPYRMAQVNKIECSMDMVSFIKCNKCHYEKKSGL